MWAAADISCWTTGPPGAAPARRKCLSSRRPGRRSTALDAQRIPLELYGVNAIPHLILFGPDGTILQRGLRGEDIYTTVAELLSR